MNKTMLAIVLSIVILVIVLLIYYFMIYIPSKQKITSQALTVATIVPPTSVPSTTAPPPIQGIPFYVHSGSALAPYAFQPVKVVQGPIFVGDSAWLILQTPAGTYIAEVMNTVTAEQIGVGTTIVPGVTLVPIVV